MPQGVRLVKFITACAITLLSLSLYAIAAESDIVPDVIVGRNIKGPYTLKWSQIDPNNITVVYNGRTLRKGSDYDIDCAQGMLSFNSVVLNDTIIHVTYSTIPGKSQRNAGSVNVPIRLNVFQKQDASMQVMGFYSQDDPNNPNAAKTIIGLGGEKIWGAGKVNSQFFISQHNDNGNNDNIGTAWDRSAFKVGAETGPGRLKFSASMAHAGEEFKGGGETGLGAGAQSTNLAITATPTKNLQATASLQRDEKIAGGQKTDESQTQQISVAAKDSSNIINGQVTLTQKTSEAQGDEQSIGANVSANPVDQVKVNVNYGSLENNSVGQQTSQGAKIEVAPVKQVAIDADYSGTDSTKLGQSESTDVGMQIKPADNTQIQVRQVTNTNNNMEQYQRDLSIVSKPVSFAKMTASLSQKGVDQNDDVTKAAALEVSPFAHTRLSAGYIYRETGPQVMTIRDYAAVTAPCRFISMEGSLRDRQADNDQGIRTAKMGVSLNPLDFLSVVGGYQANPEDQAGQVQTYNSTNVGVKMRVGSVGVTTDYNAKNEYTANRTSDERKLGLDVPVFRNGKLSTGVKIARYLDGSEFSTRTYSLGYAHDLGSTFKLSLTGYFTNQLQNNMVQPDKTEYSAEASLGIKF